MNTTKQRIKQRIKDLRRERAALLRMKYPPYQGLPWCPHRRAERTHCNAQGVQLTLV